MAAAQLEARSEPASSAPTRPRTVKVLRPVARPGRPTGEEGSHLRHSAEREALHAAGPPRGTRTASLGCHGAGSGAPQGWVPVRVGPTEIRTRAPELRGHPARRSARSAVRISGAPADVTTPGARPSQARQFALAQGLPLLLGETWSAIREPGSRLVGTMRLGSGTFAACCIVIEVLGVALFLRGFFPTPVRSSSRTEHQAEPPAEPSAGTDLPRTSLFPGPPLPRGPSFRTPPCGPLPGLPGGLFFRSCLHPREPPSYSSSHF